jgi:hypothetical protein
LLDTRLIDFYHSRAAFEVRLSLTADLIESGDTYRDRNKRRCEAIAKHSMRLLRAPSSVRFREFF